MRDDDLRESNNIEDRRGIPGGVGGLGIGAVIVLTLIGWATGINPATLIGGAEQLGLGQSAPQQTTQKQAAPVNDATRQFVARILGETEDVWTAELPRQAQRQYRNPTLVLFSGTTDSGCGSARAAMGPFYCPIDQKLYLDTAFFDDMRTRMGGGGEFAYAYVIAHEVGHHVQNLLGLLPKVQAAEEQNPDRANDLSVRTELMADCFAGVWANKMEARHNNLTDADIQQAVSTATAIGDDRLQRQARGVAVPDSFTHGSSAQRVQWLTTGLRQGTVAGCNTFK